MASLFYLISRADPIPDTDQPVLGEIDDVAVFLLVWRVFRSQCPTEVWEDHLHRIKPGESGFDRDLTWLKEYASNLTEYMDRNLDMVVERHGKGSGGGRPLFHSERPVRD